jgi:hypothetical protein
MVGGAAPCCGVSMTVGAGPAVWLRLWSIRLVPPERMSGDFAAEMHWMGSRPPLGGA